MKYKTNISYRTRKYYNMLKKELMKISKTSVSKQRAYPCLSLKLAKSCDDTVNYCSFALHSKCAFEDPFSRNITDNECGQDSMT